MLFRSCLPLCLVGLTTISIADGADIFLLKQGGRVEGTWLNRSDEPPKSYRVRTQEGSEIELLASNVKRVVEASPEERRYEALLPRMPATADGNWRMAEWCRRQKLMQRRTRHLEAVIELDPDHADARRALGFTIKNGQWARPDDVMRARGYVRYNGKWYLPQEVDAARAQDAAQDAAKLWRTNIKRWHGWLDTKRDGEARQQFAMIDQPAAATPIRLLLEKPQETNTQKMLMKSLAQIGGPAAEQGLVHMALTSDNPTIREIAREHLMDLGAVWAYPQFLQALRDPRYTDRAAFALEMIGNPEAIVPLIDVLVTRHKVKKGQGGPGSINTTFGNGPNGAGTGFSTGGNVQIENKEVTHEGVLNALKSLTGVNHGYDQQQWRAWYSESNTPTSIDLRRGP